MRVMASTVEEFTPVLLKIVAARQVEPMSKKIRVHRKKGKIEKYQG